MRRDLPFVALTALGWLFVVTLGVRFPMEVLLHGTGPLGEAPQLVGVFVTLPASVYAVFRPRPRATGVVLAILACVGWYPSALLGVWLHARAPTNPVAWWRQTLSTVELFEYRSGQRPESGRSVGNADFGDLASFGWTAAMPGLPLILAPFFRSGCPVCDHPLRKEALGFIPWGFEPGEDPGTRMHDALAAWLASDDAAPTRLAPPGLGASWLLLQERSCAHCGRVEILGTGRSPPQVFVDLRLATPDEAGLRRLRGAGAPG